MLRLLTFGGLSIDSVRSSGNGAARRRPLALLALLAIAGQRGLSREKVVCLLWPESDQERGRNSLSQALTMLRRDLAVADLVIGTTELRLSPVEISSDVDEFERCITKGELERAAELYRGPFLDGYFLKEAPEFERWVEEQRSRFQQVYGDALTKLARQADARADRVGALTWWRRLVTLEPTSAAAALGFMEASAVAGERAAALQYYRVHQALLQQELGVAAEDAVSSLAARLRQESESRVSQQSAPPNQAPVKLEASARSPISSAAALPNVDHDSAKAVSVQELNTRRQHSAYVRQFSRWLVIGTAVGLITIALVALRQRESHSQYNPRRVVVTGFVNRTGDTTLDAFGFLAADYFTEALQRSGLVEVTDPVTSLSTVLGVRDSAEALDEAKETRLVAEATGAGLLVSGRYSLEGDSIVVVARVSDGPRGKLIAVTEPVRGSAAVPGEALDRVRQRVLGILAVQLDVQLRDVFPPGSTSPPTLPAYGEFVAGLLQFQRSNYAAAVSDFQRAYELDSTFVAPLIWQAFAFGNSRLDSERRDVVQEIARNAKGLSALDRWVLKYLETTRVDLAGQIAALQQASKLAPGSIWTYNLAIKLNEAQRFDEAAVAFEQIDRKYGWTSKWPPFWPRFLESLHYSGNHRRELEIAREGRHAMSDDESLVLAHREARALAALGKRTELRQVISEMRALPDTNRWLGFFLNALAAELRSRGDTAFARELNDSAVKWYRSLLSSESERRDIMRSFAMALYEGDRWGEARSHFEKRLAENSQDLQALMFTGLCAAHLGERQAAQAVMSLLVAAGDSAQWFEGGHRVDNLEAAARIAAALGERESAVRFLRASKDRGRFYMSRHLLSKLSKDLHRLMGYAPFMEVTQP